MKIGKVETHILEKCVFNQLQFKHPQVLVRGSVGEDCAVVAFGTDNLVITTDPITGTTADIGSLSIDIVCNDLASNGIRPLGILLTLMLPVGTTEKELADVMSAAAKRALELEVEIIGGHTEVTAAVNRMVISATAIGKQPADQLIQNCASQPGDVILLTKSIGLEGAGILAYEKEKDLEKIFTAEALQRVKGFLKQTSVVAEGLIASAFKPHAMHDVTEGGLLGALYEMCTAARIGCSVQTEKLPLEPEVIQLCSYFQIDPLRLISSGAMLMVVPPERSEALTSALTAAGIPCTAIGVMTEGESKRLYVGEEFIAIEPPQSDALYDVLT